MDKLRVGYVCCARLTFDGDYAKQLFERSLKSLSQMDVELVHGSGSHRDRGRRRSAGRAVPRPSAWT